jgi:hypothetical protein
MGGVPLRAGLFAASPRCTALRCGLSAAIPHATAIIQLSLRQYGISLTHITAILAAYLLPAHAGRNYQCRTFR